MFVGKHFWADDKMFYGLPNEKNSKLLMMLSSHVAVRSTQSHSWFGEVVRGPAMKWKTIIQWRNSLWDERDLIFIAAELWNDCASFSCFTHPC